MECGNTSTAPTIIQSAAARLTSKGLSSCTTATTIPDMMGGDDNTSSLVSFFFMTSSSTAGFWTTLSIVRLFATFTIVFSIGCICIAFFLRRRTKQILQDECGLPTVFWRPKFINYLPNDLLQNTTATINHKNTNDAIKNKLNASNITNILPRMQRLAGPYDMYATVYGIQTKVIHVAHPIPAKLILNATRTKSPGYNHFKNFCGDGVFTADEEEWRDKRASVIHALFRSGGRSGGNRSDRLEKECNVAASEFLKAVFIEKVDNDDDNKINTGDGWGVIPNVVPLLQRATVGIIYRYLTHDDSTNTFQNASSNDVSSNGNKDQQSSILSSEPTTCLLSTYLQSITHIRMIILAQARSIWFLLPRFCYTLFSPMFKMEEQTMIPIRAVARLACCSARPNSPLAMLQQRPSHNTSTTTVASSRSDKEEDVNKDMLDEAITLLFAGQDTSAATLSWTLHLLSLHPLIQHKLHQEILLHALENHDDTTTSSTSSRYISKKAASNMRYLDAVIKESMRLYPVAPFVVRMLEHDISIPPQSSSKHHPPTNKHTKLPKNSLVCIWIHALHHNPKLWKDPDRFLPERWLQSDHDLSSSSAAADATNDNDVGGSVPNGAYMPFATGPRNCLGQPIANIVLRVMLARILSDIEVLDPNLLRLKTTKQDAATNTNTAKVRDNMDDNDVHRFKKDMQAGFTVLPVGGVDLFVRKRSVEER